ncbi:MAG TPA: BTAD domain-containing putative transcriptional regulator, partial [Thermoanaerobaculia bacterium]|nr:BTAD domain-containing putative transcriptional regulator [Thermoanaerobaculia bacterium]
GRSALLSALLDGPRTAALAPAELRDRERRCRAVEDALAAGARTLVVQSLPRGAEPGEVLGDLAELLPADRRLVFAAARRVPAPAPLCDLLTPRDLALTPAETAELLADGPVPTETVSALTVAADGWYRPLLLAAGAAREGQRLPATPEALAAVPEVGAFLRARVLAELPPEDRAGLQGFAADPEGADAEAVRRLTEDWGFLFDDDGGLRLPWLLRAWLAREEAASARRPDRPRPAGPAPATATGGEPEPPVAIPEAVLFRLHLLGRPEGWRREPGGGWRRLHWPLKRSFKVLAYLATAPDRRAGRDELIEALWGEEGEEAVRRNFHPTLSHLRRGLKEGLDGGNGVGLDPLLLADGVYRLNPELGWWLDADEFERLTARGRAAAEEGLDEEAVAAWEGAWRLYRGDLLAGVDEPWANRRREAYQRRYLVLLQELGGACERLARAEEALDAYRAVLVEDALQERVHLALMRIYGRRGRRDLVRRQYDRLAGLLRQELGVEPLPETTEEYHRLMAMPR